MIEIQLLLLRMEIFLKVTCESVATITDTNLSKNKAKTEAIFIFQFKS